MKSLTISEGFKQAIGERTVTQAFFSTYCFEPDFFELDVLPLLLGEQTFSTDENIRYHQLQASMNVCNSRFAVAYDVDVFDPQFAPRLEVDYIPVRVGGACQHAKIAVLEVVDDAGKVAIILAAGSFNLTKAGWWTNIEVGHWFELNQESAPSNIVKPLAKALAFFQRDSSVPTLIALQATLNKWKITTPDDTCTFYFSGAGENRQSFPSLLKDVNSDFIDIVSPFFSEQGDNEGVARFLRRFKKVSLLLPTDEDLTATMTQAVYENLSKLVTWCQWHENIRSSFALSADKSSFRKLHAKIYSGDSWLFVGSVNLSFKALHQNVEAGFLLKQSPRLKLLSTFNETPNFSPTDPIEATTSHDIVAMPPIQLFYDWLSGKLDVISPDSGNLTLYDAEGVSIGNFPLMSNMKSELIIEGLFSLMKHSALIAASWTDPNGNQSEKRNLLVSQRKIYCRPSSLPNFDLQDLLRIFQNMSPIARMTVITDLAAKQARLNISTQSSNEFLPALSATDQRKNFFSEFSEINGAFWNLKEKLRVGGPDERAYYLDGQQPDSLSGLTRALNTVDQLEHISVVVRYLTLLSMNEILLMYPPMSDDLLRDVQKMINETEDNEEFNAIPDKMEFLSWIKEKFNMQIKPISPFTERVEQNNE